MFTDSNGKFLGAISHLRMGRPRGVPLFFFGEIQDGEKWMKETRVERKL